MRKITTFPSTSTHCKVKAEASFLTILLSLLPLFQTIMDSPLYLLKSSWILMTDSPGQKLGFDLIIIKSLGKVMNIKMVNSGCFPYRSIGVTPPYDFIQVQHSQQDSHASDQTICTYWGGSAGRVSQWGRTLSGPVTCPRSSVNHSKGSNYSRPAESNRRRKFSNKGVFLTNLQ